MARAQFADGWNDKTDQELLTIILESRLTAEEKAKEVLAMRERKVAERRNLFVLLLTVAVTIATIVQAAASAVTILKPSSTKAEPSVPREPTKNTLYLSR